MKYYNLPRLDIYILYITWYICSKDFQRFFECERHLKNHCLVVRLVEPRSHHVFLLEQLTDFDMVCWILYLPILCIYLYILHIVYVYIYIYMHILYKSNIYIIYNIYILKISQQQLVIVVNMYHSSWSHNKKNGAIVRNVVWPYALFMKPRSPGEPTRTATWRASASLGGKHFLKGCSSVDVDEMDL